MGWMLITQWEVWGGGESVENISGSLELLLLLYLAHHEGPREGGI